MCAGMKPCTEIKHVLKSRFRTSFPTTKGDISESEGGFFGLFDIFIFLNSRVPAADSLS